MLMLRTKGITLEMNKMEMLMLMIKVTGLGVEGGRKLVEELAAKTKQVEEESFLMLIMLVALIVRRMIMVLKEVTTMLCT